MIEYKDQQYWNGQLIHACCSGNLDGVKTALLHGADVNYQTNRGWTPLMEAARTDHVDIVQFLLQHPDIDVNAKNESGFTALMAALRFNRLEHVPALLKAFNIDVNAKDNDGWTPVMLADYSQMYDLVKILRDAGAKF